MTIANHTSTDSQSPLPNSQSRTLVFIDERVDERPSLVAGLAGGTDALVLDRTADGIEQITAEIQKYVALGGSLDAIHIFSHGSPGSLQLGSTFLNSDNLDERASELQKWKSALGENADIVLYGCDVAAKETGKSFVNQLSRITGADIAASIDLTGNKGLGGDWDLEVATGKIEASQILSPEIMAAYNGVLATLTVTNTADSGPGSLRNAIAAASEGDTIVFDPSLANQTISLTTGQLEINKTLIIDGANAPGLTISGNDASRVLNLQPNQNLTVRNLAIANGRVSSTNVQEGGAGIKAAQNSILTVENCQFLNNSARLGGGIFAFLQSTLTVTNCKFDGNDATSGQALGYIEQSGGAIVAFVAKSLTVTDSEFTNNKGLNGGAINNLLTPATIENSTFVNNDVTAGAITPGASGGKGGAVYSDGASNDNKDNIGGQFIIRNSRFEGNKGAGQGGALHLYVYPPDEVSIENSTLINNSVIKDDQGLAQGGGLFYGAGLASGGPGSSPLTISNTTFANNIAEDQGGGLWVAGQAPVTISNSTFSGNEALDGGYGYGGAITLSNQTYPTNIVNTTFANNKAAKFAGAIFHGTQQQVTVQNTIFANNTANNPEQIQQQTSRKLIDGGNNIQFPDKLTNNPADLNVTDTVTIADPLLGPLQDNGNGILTHALLPGSPAIDAGASNGAPATDQRGITRPIDGDNNGTALVDVGAYEFMPATPEIEVLENATNIADGTANALDFGTTTVGSPITKTFTINNAGTADLNLSNLQLPTGFTLVGTLPTTVAAGGQATFSVNLEATAAGNFNGEVSLTTNDSDENPFNFMLAGTVHVAELPEIEVLENATNIADGTANALDFGTTTVGSPITKTFTINNAGTADLNLSNLQLPTGFTLVGTLPTTVAAGGQATFSVNLEATAAGNFNGEVSLTTNDSDENPFNWAIAGTVNADAPTPTPTLTPSPNPIPTPTDPDCLCEQFPTPNISIAIPISNSISTTIGGTNGDDTLMGSDTNEAIVGLDGLDILTGMSGNDNLDGGNGNDALYGNTGADYIVGGLGNNTLCGGQDADALFGDAQIDLICGDLGDDAIFGGADTDELYGNVGADTIDGAAGNDTIFGGKDSDVITGGADNDIVAGDIGDDTVIGGDGNDLLYGNTDTDFIEGDAGEDTIFGGKDNDILKGGTDNDIISGDMGDDTICGGDGAEQLYGNSGNDLIDGCLGDDNLFGAMENDTLIGNGGDDNLNGDSGSDALYGNSGADTLDGGDDSDALYGGVENDLLSGGIGDDVLFGDVGSDTLAGGSGSDRFVLSPSSDSAAIADFEDGIDLLGLAEGLTFAQLSITQGAAATEIKIASTGKLLASVSGVEASLIAANDFTAI